MLFNLLAEAAAETQKPKTTSPWTYVFFGIIVLAIIGLFVWQSFSNKKQKQEAQNMLDNLKKGDRVKTIGGICGFVYEINNEENTFVLETGSEDKKSYVKLDKGAIYQTAPKEGAVVAAENAEKAKAEEEKKAEEAKVETAQVVEEKPAKKTRKKAEKEDKKQEVIL